MLSRACTAGMPCRNGPSCRRQRCSYVHEATGLTRFLSYLTAAQRQLDICVFTLTCNEIADAILAVHKRGVRVRIITDDDQVNPRRPPHGSAPCAHLCRVQRPTAVWRGP
jgi:phosphatidylserine/phosphatidylglycerophosphate/cardiolipin synthase-like enzyme